MFGNIVWYKWDSFGTKKEKPDMRFFFNQKGPLAPVPNSEHYESLSLSLSLTALPGIQYLKHFNTKRLSIMSKVGESSENCLLFGLINEDLWHLLRDPNESHSHSRCVQRTQYHNTPTNEITGYWYDGKTRCQRKEWNNTQAFESQWQWYECVVCSHFTNPHQFI